MEIKHLTLFTNQLEKERKFYTQTLGFDLSLDERSKFSVNIGSSELVFCKSERAYIYHYCFLIPANQLQQGKNWLADRLSLIDLDGGRYIQKWEEWNADSVYFYDGSGNIAEFIVRYDLLNESNRAFNIENILSLNEISVPTDKVSYLCEQFEKKMNTKLWKGDLQRFATVGDQNGLFLIPNYEFKKVWFPTLVKIEPAPFKATVVNEGITYSLDCNLNKLKIEQITAGRSSI